MINALRILSSKTKQLFSFWIILIFLFLPGLNALSEKKKTELEETAEALTHAHFAMIVASMVPETYPNEEACFNDMAFLEMTDHHFGSPAYMSHDHLWQAIFQPDKSGKKVAKIQLIAEFASLKNDYDTAYNAMAHVLGFCSPKWSLNNTGNFGSLFFPIFIEALRYTGTHETQAIDFERIKISCYRNGKTFGIILDYPEPVDKNAVYSNPLAIVLMNRLSGPDK